MDKCEFSKKLVEYVEYDILRDGHSPAQSKFNLLNDWTLSSSGQSLFSFIGLVIFYHRYAPYMEIKLKPLQALVKQFYRQKNLSVSWTPASIKLFADLKVCITSAPVLAQFDTTRPIFLKTDWSSEGMGWILVQPANDDESQAASKKVLASGKCLFDLSKHGARLKHRNAV